MSEIKDARDAADDKGTEYQRRFERGYARDIENWTLENRDQAFLRLIVNGRFSDRALWCNRRVRRVARGALINAVLEEYQTHPQRKRFWITMAWDQGVTMEREPRLDLVALRNTAQHHLRREGLDGFGIVEVDVWKNLTGEPGRRMVAHVHFLGWPRDPAEFLWKVVEARLQLKRALTNSIGAPSVVIVPVRKGPENVAHLAMYMTKAPSAAKNPVPHKTLITLRPAELPRGSAARLVEVLAHIEAGDTMFAIGDGQQISRSVQRQIRAATKSERNAKPAPSREAVKQHWKRIRLINGSKLFITPRIVTRTGHRRELE